MAAAPSASRVAEAMVSGHFQCASVGKLTSPGALASTIVSPPSQNRWDNELPHQVVTTSTPDLCLPGQNTNQSESGNAYWNSVARIGVQVSDALAYANLLQRTKFTLGHPAMSLCRSTLVVLVMLAICLASAAPGQVRL